MLSGCNPQVAGSQRWLGSQANKWVWMWGEAETYPGETIEAKLLNLNMRAPLHGYHHLHHRTGTNDDIVGGDYGLPPTGHICVHQVQLKTLCCVASTLMCVNVKHFVNMWYDKF